MDTDAFEQLVQEEFECVPDDWKKLIRNCALLVEDEPEGGEGLLGLYRGVPTTERGEWYGVGETLPDSITLYRLPILKAAEEWKEDIREVVRSTLWHEIAHHFGFSEEEVERREREASNRW